jgi:hypothetical protein
VGEKLHTAKKLPVRLFHPLCDDFLVTEVVLVLQKMKGDHEAGVDARSTHDGGISGVQLSFKSVPIEFPGQFYQGVVEVDDGFELRLKKIRLNGGNRGFWLQGFSQFSRV